MAAAIVEMKAYLIKRRKLLSAVLLAEQSPSFGPTDQDDDFRKEKQVAVLNGKLNEIWLALEALDKFCIHHVNSL